MNKLIYWTILFSVLLGCKKFVEVDPPRTDLIKATVFSSDATARAAMTDIYYQMGNIGFGSGSISSITYLASISSDEMINGITYDENFQQVHLNSILPSNSLISALWENMYSCIYKCNAVIEGLNLSEGVSDSLKRNLIGEAKFWRAFSNFYLLNTFGDIPVITTTDYEKNNLAPRTSRSDIFQQIVGDLRSAQELLKEDYAFSFNEKIGANKVAATAMLARVHLFAGNWQNAEMESTKVIDNDNYYLLADVNAVFLKNSPEAILQFYPPSDGYAPDVITFLGYGSELRPSFLHSFAPDDKRKINWIENGIYGAFDYPVKYKSIDGSFSEYSMVLRLAEQFLIRAEARARQNKLTGINSAESDINLIRERAGIGPTTAISLADFLLAIEAERNHELFTEWGHRWYDLKRYGRLVDVLSPIKDGWNDTDTLYPIPEAQILNDPNISQNEGY